MPIRSAKEFEEQATRGIFHHKSESLHDVIATLAEYHKVADREKKLLYALYMGITNWRWWDPHEFRDRHGSELQNEVEAELYERWGGKENCELKDGDILFRLVTRMPGHFSFLNPLVGERGFVQGLITIGQWVQHVKGAHEGNVFDRVQHVGIYSRGFVIEIDGSGLSHNHICDRGEEIDLVVRTNIGPTIATKARFAKEHRLQKVYPLIDLWKLACSPGSAGMVNSKTQAMIWALDRNVRGTSDANQLQQCVVCSHFVHAVIYAAKGGTLCTATDRSMNDVFKVSPAHLWQRFRSRAGVWHNIDAEFVGVQHNGVLYPIADPEDVGL